MRTPTNRPPKDESRRRHRANKRCRSIHLRRCLADDRGSRAMSLSPKERYACKLQTTCSHNVTSSEDYPAPHMLA
ncbi:hypothetical protein BC629DRAFT_1542814 [Irpex lacteus]|nr:hypothetical protein BC629DRAFT_1542814 [Irpex lacteus]